MEASACLSFGTTGTRPWSRWKHLLPSSFLSWWVLALSCSRKVGGDKRLHPSNDWSMIAQQSAPSWIGRSSTRCLCGPCTVGKRREGRPVLQEQNAAVRRAGGVAHQRGVADNERCCGTGWPVAAMDWSALES